MALVIRLLRKVYSTYRNIIMSIHATNPLIAGVSSHHPLLLLSLSTFFVLQSLIALPFKIKNYHFPAESIPISVGVAYLLNHLIHKLYIMPDFKKPFKFIDLGWFYMFGYVIPCAILVFLLAR